MLTSPSIGWPIQDGCRPTPRPLPPASQRRDARDGARQWREGVFALAGLQFGLELEPWLGEEVSLTLTDGDSNAAWVLALTSRDDDGARRFLQRFWQTRSLAGTDLQISSYRGIGVDQWPRGVGGA